MAKDWGSTESRIGEWKRRSHCDAMTHPVCKFQVNKNAMMFKLKFENQTVATLGTLPITTTVIKTKAQIN